MSLMAKRINERMNLCGWCIVNHICNERDDTLTGEEEKKRKKKRQTRNEDVKIVDTKSSITAEYLKQESCPCSGIWSADDGDG